MNGNTILILLNIVIIGIISIIIVKLYYRDESKDTDITSLEELIPSFFKKNKILRQGKNSIVNSIDLKNTMSNIDIPKFNKESKKDSLTPKTKKYFDETVITPDKGIYQVDKIIPSKNSRDYVFNKKEVYENSSESVTIAEPDDVIVPLKPGENIHIKEKETENNNETAELKDLFTIDELIKESKRKDNERNKKMQENDSEENEIKQTISKNKDIANALNKTPTNETIEKDEKLTQASLKTPNKKIKGQATFNPNKNDVSIYEFNESEDEEYNELDYRKDLEKIKSVFRNSKIVNDVKNRINTENTYEKEPVYKEEDKETNISKPEPENKTNIKKEDDEYQPIIPEHQEKDSIKSKTHEQKLREENTRKIFTMAKNTVDEPKKEESETPLFVKDCISFVLNNQPVTLNKGDEIIFKVKDDTYSSKVYDIKGEKIYVRYRGKNIIIKSSDIKKIY